MCAVDKARETDGIGNEYIFLRFSKHAHTH